MPRYAAYFFGGINARVVVPIGIGMVDTQGNMNWKEMMAGKCPGGGIGRHAGLKILWPLKAVRVQLPSRVLSS